MKARTAEGPIDMAAVGRVARRVNLENLVLIGIKASRHPGPSEPGILDPEVDQAHRFVGAIGRSLQVESKFEFTVRQGETVVLTAALAYRLLYSVSGDEPV